MPEPTAAEQRQNDLTLLLQLFSLMREEFRHLAPILNTAKSKLGKRNNSDAKQKINVAEEKIRLALEDLSLAETGRDPGEHETRMSDFQDIPQDEPTTGAATDEAVEDVEEDIEQVERDVERDENMNAQAFNVLREEYRQWRNAESLLKRQMKDLGKDGLRIVHEFIRPTLDSIKRVIRYLKTGFRRLERRASEDSRSKLKKVEDLMQKIEELGELNNPELQRLAQLHGMIKRIDEHLSTVDLDKVRLQQIVTKLDKTEKEFQTKKSKLPPANRKVPLTEEQNRGIQEILADLIVSNNELLVELKDALTVLEPLLEIEHHLVTELNQAKAVVRDIEERRAEEQTQS